MLRACVRTVSMPMASVVRDLRVGRAFLEQLEHVGLARGEQVGALRSQAVVAAGGRGRRGSTCIPREARWMALITSRAWVSLDRQAVAPKESIWLQSAARRGGWPAPRSGCPGRPGAAGNTCAGLASEPKLSSATVGRVLSISVLEIGGGDAVGHQVEVRILGDQLCAARAPRGPRIPLPRPFPAGITGSVPIRGDGGWSCSSPSTPPAPNCFVPFHYVKDHRESLVEGMWETG